MGNTKSSGFTIIEVSLAISISALMLAGLMVGITLSIQRQRFTESINETQSFLQSQFSAVTAVQNEHAVDRTCGGAANPVGASSVCVVYGRAIKIVENTAGENVIRSYAVVGKDMSNDKNLGIVELFNEAELRIVGDQTSDQAFIIPWGAKITDAIEYRSGGGEEDAYGFAILKSPITDSSSLSGGTGIYSITQPITLTAEPGHSDWLSQPLTGSAPGDGHIRILEGPIGLCIKSQDAIASNGAVGIKPIATQDAVIGVFDQKVDGYSRQDLGCAS